MEKETHPAGNDGRHETAWRTEMAAPGVSHAIAGLQAVAASLRGLAVPDQLPAGARLALIKQLEDDARDSIARVLAEPQRIPVHGMAGWARFADEVCAVFGALLDAYVGLSASNDLPADGRAEVDVRLAGAAAQRVKWEVLSCGPEHPALWRSLGAVWAHAGERSAAARECLRALAYFSGGLDQLPIASVIAADRLITLVLPHLDLVRKPEAGVPYLFAPASGLAPRRMVQGGDLPEGGRYFATRVAAKILAGLAAQLAHGVVPAGLGAAQTDDVLTVAVQTLLRQWSDRPPVRRFRRHLLDGRLTAVCGFEELKKLIGSGARPAGRDWLMHDVCRGGVGALVSAAAAGEVQAGDLVGLRAAESETWHLGIVRRKRAAGSERLVGVETLSQKPEVVSVDDGRRAAEVLLCDPILKGEAVRLLAPLDTLTASVPLFLTFKGTIQKLKPLDAVACGGDFELRVYQVL
ncbi:hypothetical protein [Pseudothauera rhizosphaerae]|uniref:Uncharacterized protein n=1 Tax=Pseudothauera rhizosphaerae TaxID=2565932 RepID=A0A4S4APE1_9RHOO|nr:hypothetical protein [Pseudothauera rhizosphaerae]THF61553.1 hypothetical protein E6O51_08835 [Pseudothauera rhizosphaerae]